MKDVKLAESTSLVLLAQLLLRNQVKIVCLRRLTTNDVKSIMHAVYIHRDSCYWLSREEAFIAVE